jgi:hypothetical protein
MVSSSGCANTARSVRGGGAAAGCANATLPAIVSVTSRATVTMRQVTLRRGPLHDTDA